MPNLKPPVTTVAAAAAYRDRILAALPPGVALRAAHDAVPHRQHPAVRDRGGEGVRLRARGEVLPRRRHDELRLRRHGASSACTRCSTAMEKHDVVLSLHGEVTDPDVDMFDRERVFVDTLARAHRARLSRAAHRARAHHDARGRGLRARRDDADRRHDHAAALLWSRSALFVGGLRPHFYCLPILKRESHRRRWSRPRRRAIRASSSAPTRRRTRGTRRKPRAAAPAATRRRSRCRCTPKRSTTAGALDRLENFASGFGADFYGLPRNADTVTLVREPRSRTRELSVRRRHARPGARGRDGGLAVVRAKRVKSEVRSQPDRRCLPSCKWGEESPGSAEQDAG